MRRKNEVAYCELLVTMDDPVCITCVNDARTDELPSGDTKKAWMDLKELYEPKNSTTKMLLK